MKLLLGLTAALLACQIAPARAQATDKPVLAVCMQQNDPPAAFRSGARPSGFDPALAAIIAQRLGRDLRIQWFSARDDPDASLAKDFDALLSDGRCDLVAEFPLTEGTLEPPRLPTTRIPPFDGAKPEDRRRWVKIGLLAPTRPYRTDTLTVVLSARNADHPIHTLGDLADMKTGVRIATLCDAIAMQYGDGRLAEHVVHVADANDLFTRLRDGALDAVFVDSRAFDAWRMRNSSTGLEPSGYRHSIGFNMGFAGLASNRTLIDQVDTVLADLQAHDAIAPLATSAGMTFVPPHLPAISPNVVQAALKGD